MKTLLAWFLPWVGWLYLRIVGLTSRIVWINKPLVDRLESQGQNFIYAFWHSRQLFFVWSHRGKDIGTVVSRSQDGEYVARLIHLFGMKTARGSSTRGGDQALLELLEMAKVGTHPAFTPDGPRGPAGAVEPGVIFLAQKSRLPIVPIANALSRKKVLNSWDKYQVPLPFTRAVVVHGNPLWIKPEETLEDAQALLRRQLDLVTQEADRLAAATTLR